jgi:hypothetical protein
VFCPAVNEGPPYLFVFTATSTAALTAGEELEAEEEGGLQSGRFDALVEEFWHALSRTGVDIVEDITQL